MEQCVIVEPTKRGRGRPPAATREDVLEAARRTFAANQRVDVRELAAELGIGRVTVYRWYGSREGLLAELMLDGLHADFDAGSRTTGPRGATRVLHVFEHLMRAFTSAGPMRHFAAQEPALARKLFTDPSSIVHQHSVAAMRNVIETEVGRRGWYPPVEVGALAYVAVGLLNDLFFTDPEHGLHGDQERLMEVMRALLGVTPPLRNGSTGPGNG